MNSPALEHPSGSTPDATGDSLLAVITASPLPDTVPDMLDELRELETLKHAIEARQARLSVQVDHELRRDAAAAGIPAERQGRGIAERIALARRTSPHRGRQLLGLAKSLAEMPHTMAAFNHGLISEWRATLLVRETTCLELADRQRIDTDLATDPIALSRMGDREAAGRARARAGELDAASVARRRARAESERCVTIRPAPDTMVYLTALLPVAQGVSVYAALKQAADTAVATGQGKTRGQVMADTLTQRITCAATDTGDRDGRPVFPIALNLTMSEANLLDPAGPDGNEAAWCDNVGQVPAGLARELLADALDHDQLVTLRRLFTSPNTGQLVAMESTARCFPSSLARFIHLRDRYCASPWCDAPIRHVDHARPAAEGGPTSASNGRGRCEQCNYARESGVRPPDNGPPPLRRPDPPTQLRPRRRPLVLETHHPAITLEWAA